MFAVRMDKYVQLSRDLAASIAIYVFIVLIVLINSWQTLSKGDHNSPVSPMTSLAAQPLHNNYHTCSPV